MSKVRICGGLLLAALCMPGAAAEADLEAKTTEQIERAQAKLKAQDYKGALKAAEDALEDAPGSAKAHALAATALAQLGKSKEAASHLEDAIRFDPAMKGLHYLLGYLSMERASSDKHGGDETQKRFADAAAEFEKELVLDPGSLESLAGRAIALSRSGQTESAIVAHDAWIAAGPGRSEPYVSLIRMLGRLGRPEPDLIAVLDRAPQDAASLRADIGIEIGRVLLYRGQNDRVIELGTTHAWGGSTAPTGHALLAVAYAALGKKDDARVEIVRFAAAAPTLQDRLPFCPLFPDSFWPDSAASKAAPPETPQADSSEPEVLTRVPPQYPDVARRARLEGSARVHALLTEEGHVSVLCVEATNPIFAKPAVAAVEQWEYRPATIGGKPVVVLLTLFVTFQLG